MFMCERQVCNVERMTSDVTVADRLLLTEQEERELADELLHPAVDVGGDGVGGRHADHGVPYHVYPQWARHERLKYMETSISLKWD